MMGGDGHVEGELTELHMSAIGEAMNQMVGSAATSLSSMFEKRVDISPPDTTLIDSGSDIDRIRVDNKSNVVAVRFSLQVGDLIDSEIMQILPIDFARDMVKNLYHTIRYLIGLNSGEIPEMSEGLADSSKSTVPAAIRRPVQSTSAPTTADADATIFR